MPKSEKASVNRRDFLKSVAVRAAALAATPKLTVVQPTSASRHGPLPPIWAEAEVGTPSPVDVLTTHRTGSDLMVDMINSLGIVQQ